MQELLDLRDEVDKLARLAACDRLLEQAADLKDRVSSVPRMRRVAHCW